ncbi:MAG: endo-1,4-beta-xylanase [Opitutales bacterium]|jgi:endo-1,4-beta-xylanase
MHIPSILTASVIAVAAPALSSAVAQVAVAEQFVPTGPEIARGKSKFLGSCYSAQVGYNLNYSAYWNGMWPGNSGKWGYVEGTRDVMNWTDLDEAYNFAKEHGYPFNMHILIWGNQQPEWIYSLPSAEQLAEIREWFQAVAARYPDIDYLQVVNEPLHAPPDGLSGNGSGNYINALGGLGTTGHDWIIEAFRMAREYFPGTPLMINDYNIIGSSAATADYVNIIEDLKAEDLIDLIGIQGHAFSTVYYSAAAMRTNLATLASTGLPIMVTEMDIDGLDDQVQLAEYQRVFPIFWESPSVIGVNISGHRIGMWRTEEGAYLANSDESERPALQWLRQYVQSEPWHGYPAEYDWGDMGDWMGGYVYIGFLPWVYADGHWVWTLDETYDGEGLWAFINNPTPGTSTAADNWMGYDVDQDWAATGDWLGDVYVEYAPWVWTDIGWVYMDDSWDTGYGAWGWMQK